MAKKTKIAISIAVVTTLVVIVVAWGVLYYVLYLIPSPIQSREHVIQIAREHVSQKYGDQFDGYYATIDDQTFRSGHAPWIDAWVVFFTQVELNEDDEIWNSDIGAPIVTIKNNGRARSTIRTE